MLMEPARKRVNDQARLSSGGENRNEKERHYERPRLTQKTSPRRIEPVRADQSGVLPFSHRCVSRVPEQSVPEFYPLFASPWQINPKPTACMCVRAPILASPRGADVVLIWGAGRMPPSPHSRCA